MGILVLIVTKHHMSLLTVLMHSHKSKTSRSEFKVHVLEKAIRHTHSKNLCCEQIIQPLELFEKKSYFDYQEGG